MWLFLLPGFLSWYWYFLGLRAIVLASLHVAPGSDFLSSISRMSLGHRVPHIMHVNQLAAWLDLLLIISCVHDAGLFAKGTLLRELLS